MVFGNLLEAAHRLIPFQPFTWYKWKGYTLDSALLKVNEYEAGVACQGSIQRISEQMYERLGLDFNSDYREIHTSANIQCLTGQNGPDMLEFEGKRWKVIRVTPWYNYDGWSEILVIEDKENNAPQN